MPRSAADRSAGRAVGPALAVCALACVLVGPGSPRALGATADPSAAGPTRSADVPDEHLTASVRGLDTAGSVLTIDLADAVSPLHFEERRDDQLVVTISADVLFAFDSADLTDVARSEITKLAPRVRPGTETVTVLGHTDKLGTPAYNVMLSQRRADAVARVLRSLLPAGTRVSATGRGGADPVAPNIHPDGSDDPDGRALNRRVQISFPAS